MQDNWLTKQDDMALANTIIDKYVELNDGEPVALFEIIIKQHDMVDIRLADWILEIAEHFEIKYGHEKGNQITKWVMSNCLVNGATLH